MFKRLTCLFKKHQWLCDQMILIDPDGNAEVDHTHECLRCGKIKVFPTKTLDTEIGLMLRDAIKPQTTTVAVDDGDKPKFLH
jgi:hypothetical protein